VAILSTTVLRGSSSEQMGDIKPDHNYSFRPTHNVDPASLCEVSKLHLSPIYDAVNMTNSSLTAGFQLPPRLVVGGCSDSTSSLARKSTGKSGTSPVPPPPPAPSATSLQAEPAGRAMGTANSASAQASASKKGRHPPHSPQRNYRGWALDSVASKPLLYFP
jgi:hypothetical protein